MICHRFCKERSRYAIISIVSHSAFFNISSASIFNFLYIPFANSIVKPRFPFRISLILEGVVPRRMFLHRGGHGSTRGHSVPQKIQAWFDYFLEDDFF